MAMLTCLKCGADTSLRIEAYGWSLQLCTSCWKLWRESQERTLIFGLFKRFLGSKKNG
jgi:hypothetical protein